MLPTNLRIVLICVLLLYFILILIFLKNKAIELRYTLLWLFVGLCMAILIFFPEVLTFFVQMLGITSNMNGLFVFCIAFLGMIIMELTSIVSRQAGKIRRIAQSQALLEQEVRRLKMQQEAIGIYLESEEKGE